MKTNSALRFFACIILMGCMAVTNAQNKYTVPADTAVIDVPEDSINAEVFEFCEIAPSFPGGEAALFRWLNLNIKYPDAACNAGIQGKVIVSFVVERDGSVSDIRLLRRKHPALDGEACRLVGSMPRWIPGQNNGQPVRARYSLPITFKLQQ